MKPRSTVADRLGEHLRPTGQETSLDIAFPDERVRFKISPRLALAAAGVVAVLMGLIIAWSLFGAERDLGAEGGGPVVAETDALGAGQLPEVAAAGAGEPGGDIVVSVVGAVAEPGLATLAPGARVADAIAVSGGLTAEANPMALNQAQLVVDGQQVVVPDVGAGAGADVGEGPGAGAAVGAGDGMVSLNSATAAELTTLDGVGEATAAAILDHRQQIGGFTTIEQLLDVSGIGPAKFASMKEQVTL